MTNSQREALERDAFVVGCCCHEGPEDSTVHGAGIPVCPVCELIASHKLIRGTTQDAPDGWRAEPRCETVRRCGKPWGHEGPCDPAPTSPTPDANVEAVRDKLLARSQKGLAKYGVTTERGDLSEAQWLEHLQEELMDGAIYVQRLLATSPALESSMIPIDAIRASIAEQLEPASPAVPSGELLARVEMLSMILTGATSGAPDPDDCGAYPLWVTKGNAETLKLALAALRAAQPGPATPSKSEGLDLEAIRKRWKARYECDIDEYDYRKSESARDVPYLIAEVERLRRAAPSPTDATEPQGKSRNDVNGDHSLPTPAALVSPTDASTEARERTNELMQPGEENE